MHLLAETPSFNDDWVVQKFGGTSLGKFSKQIVDDIILEHSSRSKVAVVCSALSSRSKSEGTTSRLMLAFNEALRGRDTFRDVLQTLLSEHIQQGEEVICSEEILECYIQSIQMVFADLHRQLQILRKRQSTNTVSEDVVISKGEVLACLFVIALIQDSGRKAHLVDMSDIIPFSDSEKADGATFDLAAVNMGERVSASYDSIPVVTGAFGAVPGGLLANVGRGYTDLCAALLAVGLRAKELQIWKEVDGIFTADPNRVPSARLLPHITPSEVATLTARGAEVLHPLVSNQVITHRIPVVLKNVQFPRNHGTRVSEVEETKSQHNAHQNMKTKSKSVVGVASKNNIMVLRARKLDNEHAKNIVVTIMYAIHRLSMPIDFVSIGNTGATFAISTESSGATGPGKLEGNLSSLLVQLRQEFGNWGVFDLQDCMSVISLVGRRDVKGVNPAEANMALIDRLQDFDYELVYEAQQGQDLFFIVEKDNVTEALNKIHGVYIDQ